MDVNNIISVTDLRKRANTFIKSKSSYVVVVHNKPQKVFLSIDEYQRLKNLERYEPLFKSIQELSQNASFDFLKSEPNLYENY